MTISARIKRGLRRIRHFRGHGVHSPFVYKIVRNVFMRRTLIDPDSDRLLSALSNIQGVSRSTKIELQNLYTYCNLNSFVIDPQEVCNLSQCDIVILTGSHIEDAINKIAKDSGITIVALNPRHGRERSRVVEDIIAHHHSTTIERRAYLLIYNNHLPKQHFTI